jgi:erythronate-4-phosphate dehydrogenase
MKIFVDKAMPYWLDFFGTLGEIVSFNAGDLALDESGQLHMKALIPHLSDAECLLVRSTTKVNNALLAKMPNLKFVATATAGYDHLDIPALEAKGIEWYAAGGCNAQAVAQYVVCAILSLATEDNFLIKDKVIAVVGHGNVGSKVAKAAKALGAAVIVYDPPQEYEVRENIIQKSAKNCTSSYATFEEVLKADIICLHAPFNSHLAFPSKHMFDAKALGSLTNMQYLINAGRGELIDNKALLTHKQKHGFTSVHVVLDVWENEPNIMTSLIPFLRLASAHIAGHSLEGKANGTAMLYTKLCRVFDIDGNMALDKLLPTYHAQVPEVIIEALQQISDKDEYETQNLIKNLCHFVYDIQNDDRVFRHHMSQFSSFAKLRQEYPIRREFSALDMAVLQTETSELLKGIGFIISNDSTTPLLIK